MDCRGALNVESVKAMGTADHRDRAAFRTERDTTANPDLKSTVSTGKKVLEQHTDAIGARAIDALATGLNLPVPADSAPMPAPAM